MNAMLYSKWKNPSSAARKDLAAMVDWQAHKYGNYGYGCYGWPNYRLNKNVVACKQFGDRCMPDSRCFGYSQTGF